MQFIELKYVYTDSWQITRVIGSTHNIDEIKFNELINQSNQIINKSIN